MKTSGMDFFEEYYLLFDSAAALLGSPFHYKQLLYVPPLTLISQTAYSASHAGTSHSKASSHVIVISRRSKHYNLPRVVFHHTAFLSIVILSTLQSRAIYCGLWSEKYPHEVRLGTAVAHVTSRHGFFFLLTATRYAVLIEELLPEEAYSVFVDDFIDEVTAKKILLDHIFVNIPVKAIITQVGVLHDVYEKYSEYEHKGEQDLKYYD